MKAKLLVILSVLIVIAGLIIYTAFPQESDSDFKIPHVSLVDSNGVSKPIQEILSSYSGKRVLVHFWATWCPPCREELPSLIQLSKELNDQVVVFFVAVNDNPQKVETFVEGIANKIGFNPLVFIDSQLVHRNSFGTFQLPETYLFDSEKNLIQKFSGPQSWTSSLILNN